MFIVLMALGAYGAWREYDFRQAIKEAQALGWDWLYEDPIVVIQKDWKAAFRRETWFEGMRTLSIDAAHNDVDRHVNVVYRLRPGRLWIHGSKRKDLFVLEGLTELQSLDLTDCTDLTNVDALKRLSALKSLLLHRCPGLKDVDALKGLTALQGLSLDHCPGLTKVDALKGLSALQYLDLTCCTGLNNLDALKALPALQRLGLLYCTGLTNVDGLRELTGLKQLDVRGCTGLSADVVADLRAALPNTVIHQ